MFVVLLTFSANKTQASEFMEAHNAWLSRGFEDGVFVLAGGLQPRAGGGILAHSTSMIGLQARVSADPFVAEDVVSAQIFEIAPGRTDERLAFLKKA